MLAEAAPVSSLAGGALHGLLGERGDGMEMSVSACVRRGHSWGRARRHRDCSVLARRWRRHRDRQQVATPATDDAAAESLCPKGTHAPRIRPHHVQTGPEAASAMILRKAAAATARPARRLALAARSRGSRSSEGSSRLESLQQRALLSSSPSRVEDEQHQHEDVDEVFKRVVSARHSTKAFDCERREIPDHVLKSVLAMTMVGTYVCTPANPCLGGGATAHLPNARRRGQLMPGENRPPKHARIHTNSAAPRASTCSPTR